jgi:chromosome segregation ATPase
MQSESEKELQTISSRDCSHDHLGEATAWGGQVDELMRTVETVSADLDVWKSRCRDLQNLVRSLLAERVILLNTVEGERNHNQINVSTINGFQNGRDSLAGSVRLPHYAHGIVLNAVAGEHAENDRAATTTDDLKTEQVMQDDTVVSPQSDKEVPRNTIVDMQQENEQLVNIAKGVQQENEVLVNSLDNVLSDNGILRSALQDEQSHKETLVNALFALQNANASQSGTIQVLQDANHRFRAHITSLESENERLQLAIRAHEMETFRNNEIADDLLPFVRDQQGVALRTLVDGVLYAAGWNGDD